MNGFTYRDGELHAEGVPLSRIAAEFGTPTYVYSRAAIAAAYPGVTLLTAYGRITGQVTRGSNGQPVPGAMVMAVRFAAGVAVDTVASDYTDESGHYTLYRDRKSVV